MHAAVKPIELLLHFCIGEQCSRPVPGRRAAAPPRLREVESPVSGVQAVFAPHSQPSRLVFAHAAGKGGEVPPHNQNSAKRSERSHRFLPRLILAPPTDCDGSRADTYREQPLHDWMPENTVKPNGQTRAFVESICPNLLITGSRLSRLGQRNFAAGAVVPDARAAFAGTNQNTQQSYRTHPRHVMKLPFRSVSVFQIWLNSRMIRRKVQAPMGYTSPFGTGKILETICAIMRREEPTRRGER